MGGDNQQATGWLCGLIDTDGSLGIRLGHRESFAPFVSITNTRPAIIEKAAETIRALGVGCHISWKSNGTNAKDLGHVQVSGLKRVAALLPQLNLYFHQWKADLLLGYIEHRFSLPPRSAYTDTDWEIRKRLQSHQAPQRLHAMPSDFAWLAGVVDGDGALMICHGAQYQGAFRLYPVVEIVHTSPLFIEALAHMAPEHLITKSDNGPKATKPIYHFTLKGYKRAIPVVERLYPHLVGKQAQAELLLELARYRKTLPYRTPYGEYERELKRQCQQLNHLGLR